LAQLLELLLDRIAGGARDQGRAPSGRLAGRNTRSTRLPF
jgi:hypothetical protein